MVTSFIKMYFDSPSKSERTLHVFSRYFRLYSTFYSYIDIISSPCSYHDQENDFILHFEDAPLGQAKEILS